MGEGRFSISLAAIVVSALIQSATIATMPAGVPVATLAIGKAGATNASLLAAAILGNKYPKVREAVEAFDLCKALDHPGDVLERVAKFLSRRQFGLTETRKVRRYDMKPVDEKCDQVAKHVARTREAVQEQ